MADAAPAKAEHLGEAAARRRRLPISVRGAFLAALVLALLAVPLLYPVLVPYAYVLQLLTGAFMWVAFASSWNIIGGYTGYVSLGHNVFVVVGAYFSAALFVYADISPFITAIGAGLVCAVLGVAVGLITLRTRGDAFIIATIALMLIAQIGFDNWMWLGGSSGLALPPLHMSEAALVKVPFYYAMFLVAAAAVYLSYRIRHSRFGLGLRAIAQDEVKAEAAGINTRAYKVAAFALSGIFIGIGGALWAYSLFYLRPEIFLAISVAADMVLMAIIGGRGTVAGPVLGAVLIVGFNEWSVGEFGSSELNLTITGLLLVAALLFFPGGIVGSLRARGKLPRILDWD
jgi:branched-chain amino acid transport system permease protein